MAILIHVSGGTNAGWKRQKALAKWAHDCIARHGGEPTWIGRILTAYSCPDCGARRP